MVPGIPSTNFSYTLPSTGIAARPSAEVNLGLFSVCCTEVPPLRHSHTRVLPWPFPTLPHPPHPQISSPPSLPKCCCWLLLPKSRPHLSQSSKLLSAWRLTQILILLRHPSCCCPSPLCNLQWFPQPLRVPHCPLPSPAWSWLQAQPPREARHLLRWKTTPE